MHAKFVAGHHLDPDMHDQPGPCSEVYNQSMELAGSLSCSQEIVTGHYSTPFPF
jgi:hypothetical protein